ncbi:high mobility group B protein 2-like [Lycium barbarum]|uniref:high mobility group B protein 2-like n=1 Tax=Lycium barbarum TaxID=112863 RepID=UPI00293EF42F|nr:high mobility group B protein 2-like [Lycium barbarum]
MLERRLATAFVKRERRPASFVKRAQNLANDPDKPKRPANAFVLSIEELKKQFMKEKPKAKWKQLSDVDRAPYITETEKTKAEYQKNMDLYNWRVAAGSMEEEEYHKYWSKVNEEEEDDD